MGHTASDMSSRGRCGRWLLPAVARGAGLQAALQTSVRLRPLQYQVVVCSRAIRQAGVTSLFILYNNFHVSPVYYLVIKITEMEIKHYKVQNTLPPRCVYDTSAAPSTHRKRCAAARQQEYSRIYVSSGAEEKKKKRRKRLFGGTWRAATLWNRTVAWSVAGCCFAPTPLICIKLN